MYETFRYMAIAYPLRNMWLSTIGRAKKVIVIIWTISAFFAIPSAVRIDYNYSHSINGERVYWCVREFPQLFGSSGTTLNKAFALYQVVYSVFSMALFFIPRLYITAIVMRSLVIFCTSENFFCDLFMSTAERFGLNAREKRSTEWLF